ncbi:DNA-protecting protein DprA [Frischella sp. Ac48]|uniref:DNA-processing protein DprA n=1 Tax=Frischella sp. Ac48 TaxID=2804531 RepID=UPI001C7D92D6|nr:DNA-processing protein DprA [Frischella sp. Ac48]MBX4132580.1 DNA-protecting protein DprA [Frischella sp. Ac48]
MNKYELLIRFSMLEHKKPSKLKTYINTSVNDIDDELILRQCQLSKEQIQQFYQFNVQPILDWLNQDNHHLISYYDPAYPEQLKQINNAPLFLFVTGDPLLLATAQLAMVGSRQFTDYGAQWARYFAAELAINGLTITSGLALGIDAISHRGALDVKGKTIAVLGSGLNYIAPKTNHYLARDILANQGAIISEFLPNIQARSEYYPRRNRIISGLSLGTFVVEASPNSGSLITARYALEQNRDVFALPGEIDHLNSGGSHWLIKQGAYLVTKPSDILEHYTNHLNWLKKQTQLYATSSLLHNDILAVINHHAMPIDIIADKTGQTVTDVAIKLVELELEGLVKTVSGGYIKNGALAIDN